MLAWSLFTVLTGAATSFYSLLIYRFLFGVGEAGAHIRDVEWKHLMRPDHASRIRFSDH